MTAKVYQLSSNLHWYLVATHENITNDDFRELQAYVEYYQGQVRVEYS